MYAYLLNLFIDDHYTFASPFKSQPTFYTNLSEKLHSLLPGVDFTTIICYDGVVVESETQIDYFRGMRFTILVNGVELEFRVTDNHWTF